MVSEMLLHLPLHHLKWTVVEIHESYAQDFVKHFLEWFFALVLLHMAWSPLRWWVIECKHFTLILLDEYQWHLVAKFLSPEQGVFFCCSKKYGYSQSLLVPSVLPLAHELLNQRGVQVWDSGRRQEACRDRWPHRRHPLLHRRHHSLSLHSQNMQQEKKKEAGER